MFSERDLKQAKPLTQQHKPELHDSTRMVTRNNMCQLHSQDPNTASTHCSTFRRATSVDCHFCLLIHSGSQFSSSYYFRIDFQSEVTHFAYYNVRSFRHCGLRVALPNEEILATVFCINIVVHLVWHVDLSQRKLRGVPRA